MRFYVPCHTVLLVMHRHSQMQSGVRCGRGSRGPRWVCKEAGEKVQPGSDSGVSVRHSFSQIEREEGVRGEGERDAQTDRQTDTKWLPPACALVGGQTATSVCALTGFEPATLLVCGTMLQPAGPPGQGPTDCVLTWAPGGGQEAAGRSVFFLRKFREPGGSSTFPQIHPLPRRPPCVSGFRRYWRNFSVRTRAPGCFAEPEQGVHLGQRSPQVGLKAALGWGCSESPGCVLPRRLLPQPGD